MSNYRIVSPNEYNVASTSLLDKILNEIETLNLLENVARGMESAVEKILTTKKQRNTVDGSFVVTLNPAGFSELAQRIINYADQKGLTINPIVRYAKPGDSLIFGSNLKYDVNLVRTSHKSGVEELYDGGRPFASIYDLVDEFGQIIKAIDEMVEEYSGLLAWRVGEIVTGARADKPTYFELKQEEVGSKLVAEARNKNLKKELDSIHKQIGCPCEHKTQSVTVGYNFIRVGTNLIPVNDNQTVYLSV
jgi:hypothetical protein